ncbi:MAG: hypothetical protein OQL16_14390 [Gammaproteobacteria bacterium]|nr:hypothetical protein [Gammaproteobacteria bacterium]
MCALYPEVMPPGLSVEQLPDATGQGARLMQTYCTQCHELPGPGRHTADEWPTVMQHMLTLMDVADRFGSLMGNIRSPNSEEREQLQLYLSRHGLKPLQQTPEGLGSRAFESHCGACHATPDPLQYDIEGWPDILKRMQRNMTVMKYTPPRSEVMLQIQHYIQSAYTVDQAPSNLANNQYKADKNRQLKESTIHPGSLIALGPFLLLIVIGIFRWWLSSRQGHKQQIKA